MSDIMVTSQLTSNVTMTSKYWKYIAPKLDRYILYHSGKQGRHKVYHQIIIRVLF